MKFRFKVVFCFALLGLTCLVLPNASKADSFDWTYQGFDDEFHSGILGTGSGELSTTNGVITELSGTFDGLAITGLLPPGDFAGNDNLLLLPAAPLYVTQNGFSFQVSSGTQFNIYAVFGTICECGPDGCGVCFPDNMYGSISDATSDVGNFTLTPAVATPEPTVTTLLLPALLGFGLLSAWKHFRDAGLVAKSSKGLVLAA